MHDSRTGFTLKLGFLLFALRLLPLDTRKCLLDKFLFLILYIKHLQESQVNLCSAREPGELTFASTVSSAMSW